MRYRWAALVLVLALCAFAPKYAAGQSPSREHKAVGSLGPNYPNPFNPETTIPFRVGSPDCVDGSEQHVVSLRIYNVLTQLVAIPTLRGTDSPWAGSALAASVGEPVANLRLPCGNYTAFWNGHYQNTGREVASGIYVRQLIIDGQALPVKRMLVAK